MHALKNGGRTVVSPGHCDSPTFLMAALAWAPSSYPSDHCAQRPLVAKAAGVVQQ